MVVQLYCPSLDVVISSITVVSGNPACLTGTIDLPEGTHDLCVRLYAEDWEGYGDYDGAAMQVIMGQTVANPECTSLEHPNRACN